jgi:predicted Ser/Thr protein kinase
MGAPADPPAPPAGAAIDFLADTCAGQEPAIAPPAAPGPPLPRSIGRFVILRHLGQGGMGVVYAAYDVELDRKLAVKLLHHTEHQSAERRARILREAQAMARVSHPNVVHIYEVGEAAGQVFIAMEFIEGMTLGDWQRRSGTTWEQVLRMYLAAGQGLDAAHGVGLVHRDFKPDNVLVGSDQRPRVADFGLARTVGSVEVPRSPTGAGARLDSPLTMTGSILGTPAYMSPEQYRGEPADSRSDQFSFCAALYEALYKKLPFAGETFSELSENVLAGRLQPIDPASPIPESIAQALQRGLSLRPEQRFPTMRELLEALSRNPQHDPTASPRARRQFSMLLLIFTTCISIVLNTAKMHGTVAIRQFLWASVCLLLGWAGATIAMRKTLGQNSFHRRMLKILGVCAAQMVGFRTVGLLLHLLPAQLVAMEMIGLAATTLLVATQLLRPIWPVPIILVGGSLLLTQRPDLLWPVLPGLYPIVGVMLLTAWNGAAKGLLKAEPSG